MTALEIFAAALIVLSLAGMAYQLLAIASVRTFARRQPDTAAARPATTVLKPLCGAEPNLYDNLRSFCEQDYPESQVVFGVSDSNDPAVAVVKRLMADLPDADLCLVVDERIHGANLKVSNLINMTQRARHSIVVVADSDMRVARTYLDSVVGPLLDPQVGAVTCLYAARPDQGTWSGLAAMAINYGFLPSVLVSERLGAQQGCFGATIALRRETLERCGGFAALRDHLADDYEIGAMVRQAGLRLVLSRYVVDAAVCEPSFSALVRHELRWGRTIRAIAPAGYALSAITYPVVPAMLAAICAQTGLAFLTLAAALLARGALARVVERALGLKPANLALIPFRDLLSFVVLVTSFCGRKVHWRGRRFRVDATGRLIPI